MPDINISQQIKSTLTAAKDLAALKDERRRSSMPPAAALPERPALRASRRALQDVVASLLVNPGAEVEKFEQARTQYQVELRRASEEEHAAAIKQSHAEKLRLRSALDSRRQTLEALIDVDTTNAPRVLLNSPFLIWPTLGVFFDSSQIEPSNSWAKFRVDSSRTGYDEMSFYFLWDNPTDKFAVINVDGYLVLNGHCTVESDGGFWAGDRRSSVTLTANLQILEWWNQPPTSPTSQSDQSQQALHVSCHSGEMFSDGSHDSADIFRGYDLRYTLMLVPPHGVVVFEVAAAVSYDNGDGTVAVDFASGGFEVVCPAVLLTILT